MANDGSSSPPPAGSFQVDPTCPKLFMQLGLERDDAIKKLKAANLKIDALVRKHQGTSGSQSFQSKSYLGEGKSQDDTDSDEEEQIRNVALMANAGSSSPPPT